MNKFRVLVWHDQSDTLTEVNDPYVADNLISSGDVEDVTGIPEWETRLEMQKQGVDFKKIN